MIKIKIVSTVFLSVKRKLLLNFFNAGTGREVDLLFGGKNIMVDR